MKKILALVLSAGLIAVCFTGCLPGTKTAEDEALEKTVLDIENMTWEEVVSEAEGHTVTLNVNDDDPQIGEYWDKVAEKASDYNIRVVLVSETSDTDARLVRNHEKKQIAAFDMAWGNYSFNFAPFYGAGAVWGGENTEWAAILPNAKYVNWELKYYQTDCGKPVYKNLIPVMSFTPMLAYSGDRFDSSLAYNETSGEVEGLFHDLTELYAWVQEHPGEFTYPDLTGKDAFVGKSFVKSVLYELKDDGKGGWVSVYDPSDDVATRYSKIEANMTDWLNWFDSLDEEEDTAAAFKEKAAYAFKYLNDIEPYLLQEEGSASYCTVEEMRALVNSGDLAVTFSKAMTISPKLEADPGYITGGQTYMLQTSVFSPTWMMISQNSASKAGSLVICNILLDPKMQAECFADTGYAYDLELTALPKEDNDAYLALWDSLLPGTAPAAEDIASYAHYDICGCLDDWLVQFWTEEVVNK